MSSLGFPLSSPLGGDDSVTIDVPVGDVAIALDKVVEQYRALPNLGTVITAIATQTQARQDALAGLETMTSIDDSFGVQLDNIGALIDEPRQGFDDSTYKLHLKARVLLNHSSGTIEDVLNLFEVLLGAGPLLTLREDFPAALVLIVSGISLDPTFVGYLVKFLRAAKAAGVRAILEWREAADAATFTFAGGGGVGFDVGIWASAR